MADWLRHGSPGCELLMKSDDAPYDEGSEFFATYGDWAPLTVVEVAELLRGFDEAWWVVGGQAIEAFTGVARVHDDIDISFFPDAIPSFRKQLDGRYHLWSNHGGTFRLLNAEQPQPLHPLAQIWLRKDARSQWVLDVSPSPSADGKWQSKRDASHVANLEDVTWIDDRGVRFLNPEIALLFKARQNREKDRFDLDNVWPLLAREKRQWLLAALRTFNPQHPWLASLTDATIDEPLR
jgi:hypothetical protein